MTPELERAVERVVHESPVHGPVLLARIAELEEKLAGFGAEVQRAAAYKVHVLGPDCWCEPFLDGSITKHR